MATSPKIEEAAKLSLLNKTKSTFFRYKHRFGKLEIYDPVVTVLVDNKAYLISASDYVKLESQYHHRPDLLSQDMYGTPDLWYMILHINDIPSIIDFKVDFIYIPPVSIIYDYIKSYIPDKFRTIENEPLVKTAVTKPLILK